MKIFILIIFIIAVIFFIIVSNDKFYCRIFERKDWKLWEKVCSGLEKVENFENITHDDEPTLNQYYCYIEIDGIKYKVIYWKTLGFVSVHCESKCVLSSFDKFHTNKAMQIFKSKI